MPSLVDIGARRPYFVAMANRLILTLLALLTGLAAQIGPADARAEQLSRVEIARFVQPEGPAAARAPVALARLPEPGWHNVRRHAPARAFDFIAIRPATVHTGIDRART